MAFRMNCRRFAPVPFTLYQSANITKERREPFQEKAPTRRGVLAARCGRNRDGSAPWQLREQTSETAPRRRCGVPRCVLRRQAILVALRPLTAQKLAFAAARASFLRRLIIFALSRRAPVGPPANALVARFVVFGMDSAPNSPAAARSGRRHPF